MFCQATLQVVKPAIGSTHIQLSDSIQLHFRESDGWLFACSLIEEKGNQRKKLLIPFINLARNKYIILYQSHYHGRIGINDREAQLVPS